MLDELVERYGKGAIVTASPYVDDSGETLRWVLQIDGEEVSDADLRSQEDPERPDWTVMLLVRGVEEIEIGRWRPKADPHGPAGFVRTLGGLRDGY